MTLPARLDRVAYWVAPIVLILGVTFQRYNVVVHDQTPWVGGGFGMFSTVDVPGARLMRTYLLTDRGPALILERSMGENRRLVYSQPSDSRLERVANTLATQEWAVYGPESYPQLVPYVPDFRRHYRAEREGGTLPRYVALPRSRAPEAVEPLDVVIEGAQVEVWRPRFDREAARIEPVLLHSARASRLTPAP